ncbi:hypothetical protein [Sphingomonas sanxanigenens]|uniref:Uncharacterized protein n=1 Tax=Sphingomonas sanxanigenens DSM 19645 = NX02 TaxID=1123269 RepID=W0A823_9SPHN|nr:hypothetical protein [Sphingomonas sanxanigenens]AHE52627.1 hypothetical protein NX02_04400 [Sphingomonas sanxanigenens DSM 19645 = NX02]AHE57421.1 hypothetical protein NX02_29270 [Sphingomonas sanxanigenens DSM 19645 = NX02]
MIDMDALARAAEGDPNAKVTVSKKWLAEVHRLLQQRARDRRMDSVLEKVFSYGRGATPPGGGAKV